MSNAINASFIGNGVDAPEAYARIIFESYSDTTIGWRTGAKHIVIILGDSVPHYENLNEGISGNSSLPSWPGNYSTGGDPGRDGLMFTADDIYLPTALQAMATNQITLLYVKCHDGAFPDDTSNLMYWTYWTGITGGAAYGISDASNIPTAIQALVTAEASHINKLTLQAQAGFEAWLTSVSPSEYDNITIPTEGVNETFDIVITVPLGTVAGSYSFNITADADGASYGEEQVNILVQTGIPVTVVMHPETLNLKSNGNWVTCLVTPPEGYTGYDISISSILLNGTISADPQPVSIGASQLMVKFDRTMISKLILSEGIKSRNVTLTVNGQLNDGTMFTGSDTIRVFMPGDVNGDCKVNMADVALVAKAFGSHTGSPNWNPLADQNEDGKVTIADLALVCRNIGKTY